MRYRYRGFTPTGNNEAINDEAFERVVPTLMIGLGGTGKQILARFRRRLYNEFATAGLPILRMIAFDTNVESSDSIPSGESASDYDHVTIQSPQSGLHSVRICKEDYTTARTSFLNRNGEKRWQWLHPNFFDIADEATLAQGSGGHRQAGRLAFFLHLANIRRIIDRELTELRAVAQDRERCVSLPFEIDFSRLNVTIITSIAGGTGSGMFLDIGYLVKDLLSPIPRHRENREVRTYEPIGVTSHVSLIAVLPTAFAKQNAQAKRSFYTNAYASLRELEHYNSVTPKNDVSLKQTDGSGNSKWGDEPIGFLCDWSESEQISIPGRPWNSCYLIDDVNDLNRGSHSGISDVQQMVADYLFLDVGQNPFATKKRSIRSDRADVLNSTVEFEVVSSDFVASHAVEDNSVVFRDCYGCSYSSFGLAEIYIDRERLRRCASYRLVANLIRQRWLGNPDAFSTNNYRQWAQLDLFSPETEQDLSFQPEALIDALLCEQGRDWSVTVGRIFDDLTNLNPGNTPLHELQSKLECVLGSIWNCVEGTQQIEGGTIRHTLDDRVRKLMCSSGKTGLLRSQLDRRSRHRVDELGLLPVLRLLTAYENDLKQASDAVDNITHQAVTTPEEVVMRLRDALQVPYPCRRMAVRIEFQRACKDGRRAAIHWCRSAAAKLLRGIYDEALETVSAPTGESLCSRYAKWTEFLDVQSSNTVSVCAELDRLFDQFRFKPKTERRIALLPYWNAEELDETINAELRRNVDVGPDPENVAQCDWDRVERNVLSTMAQDWDTSSRCELIHCWIQRTETNADAIPDIVESVKRAGSALFGTSFGLQMYADGNVVTELLRRPDCDSLLKKMVEASAPYLPSIPHYHRIEFKTRWTKLLGLTDGSSGHYAKDAAIIAAKLEGISLDRSNDFDRDKLNALSDRFEMDASSLVFYREVRGIPIYFYDRLSQLHECYHSSWMKDHRKTCHISYRLSSDDLPDIKPMDDLQSVEIADNFLNVYRGLILGFVRCTEEGEFHVAIGQGFMDTSYHLGSRLSQIVKRACCNSDVRRFLHDRWTKWKENAKLQHIAVLYNTIQQNLFRIPRVVTISPDSEDSMTLGLLNCLTMLLDDTETELRKCPGGETYLSILKKPDPLSPAAESWHARFTDICEHVKQTCLKPTHHNLQMLQVVAERVELVRILKEERATATVASSKFDVFLSHNSKDKSDVRIIAQELKRRGFKVWLDEWELRPGLTWQDALDEIVADCRSAVVCVGRHGLGEWEEPEMLAMIRRFYKEKFRGTAIPVIPVLLPDAPNEVQLPVMLEALTRVDLRNGVTQCGMDQLEWGISGKKPDV